MDIDLPWIRQKALYYRKRYKLWSIEPDEAVSLGGLAYAEILNNSEIEKSKDFKTYLSISIRNKLIDEVRRKVGRWKTKKEIAPLEYRETDVSDKWFHVKELEQFIDFTTMLSKLNISSKHKAFLLMKYYGYTITDIAEHFGFTLSNACHWQKNLKKKVTKYWN